MTTEPDSWPVMRSLDRSPRTFRKIDASPEQIVRANHHTWPEEFAEKNLFSSCVTLDPLRTTEAWDCLSQDTFAVELTHYPDFFHRTLIAVLGKR